MDTLKEKHKELLDDLKQEVEGDVSNEESILKKHSKDTSIFQVMPEYVVYPKNTDDIKNLVSYINKNRDKFPNLSLTARSGGTDMSGGPLNESIILSFTKHFNNFSVDPKNMEAEVQPGVFYRDFEPKTLEHGLLLPSYPASKSICALGGMVSNNSAGEKTLRYGKTNKYVKELDVVLSDGREYTFKKLSKGELNKKRMQEDFEGEIYRRTHDLLDKNYDLIQKARPNVTKNSAGYALWDVWDKEKEAFDLTQLFVGAQGTLGMVTRAKLDLVKTKEYEKMAVIYMKDIDKVADVVNELLPLDPEALETFDDATLKLGLKFFPQIAKKIKGQNLVKLLWKFIPDAFATLKLGKFPKLVILAQFAEDSEEEAEKKLQKVNEKLSGYRAQKIFIHSKEDAEKYWAIRRESFKLLRKSVGDKRTAPFIDDFIVRPEKLPEFLPKVYKILEENGVKATLAGHAGSGNFHIIPLMDLSKKEEREKIPVVSDKIYDLIVKYDGSITAEHNDGLIRSPYLEKMYGEEVYNIFKEIKDIFDPNNIFNPGKKVNSSKEYAMKHISPKE